MIMSKKSAPVYLHQYSLLPDTVLLFIYDLSRKDLNQWGNLYMKIEFIYLIDCYFYKANLNIIMDNISICVSFIVAILGIAYPILLEVMSRLDEKYLSQIILDLFSKEKERALFSIALILSLSSIGLWILKLPPLISIQVLNPIIDNSSEYLLIASTMWLIVTFFLFVRKILIYYTPTKFLPYLIKKHNNSPERNNYQEFRAISDILYYSIRNQNETLAKTVSSFMYHAFDEFRNKNSNIEVVYPTSYYDLLSKTIEELATIRNRHLTFLAYRAAGNLWLLGERINFKISEDTYRCMWYNLQLSLNYDREDFVQYHWERAFQHIRFSLNHTERQYSLQEGQYIVVNQTQIDERIKERNRFLEFHYALGGLFLHSRRYSCIKRAFTFTQSSPPKYELLPETMTEIFFWYFKFRDPYEIEYSKIGFRYHFPQTSGINADSIIKQWICEYFALLFIRQYMINPYLSFMKPLDLPVIPKSQSEKRQWIDNIDYFEHLVENTLTNRELLNEIGYSNITDEWFEEKKLVKPSDLFREVKEKLIASFEGQLVEQTISEEKFQKFKATTAKTLLPLLEKYAAIDNKENFVNTIDSWRIEGLSNIMDKSSFADNQDVYHINFDSFLPESLANKFTDSVSEIFVFASSTRYLLKRGDIIAGILNLVAGGSDYVIITFGHNLSTLVEGYNENYLDKIDIIEFNSGNYELTRDSLFVLKKCDLPQFIYHELEQSEIDKYSLMKVIEKYNVYVTVKDLNRDDELRHAIAQSVKKEDLRKSVYIAIFMNLELQWKENRQCIQIQVASEYQERGIVNELSDLVPII